MQNKSSPLFLTTVILVTWLFSSQAALAEPYLAIRTGFKCGQCHVNMSGGGKRTGFGAIYTQTFLPWKQVRTQSQKSFFNGQVSDQISFGMNLRFVNQTTFGVDRPRQAYKRDNTLDITEGNLYLQMEVIKDFLSIYLDETITPSGASNRESFLLVKSLPLSTYVKAGRILLPYGLRLLDDDSFIRQKTGFNYDNQDLGAEIGFEPGPFSFSIAGSNGTQGGAEVNLDKQFSAVGSVVFRRLRVGGSFSRNRVPEILTYTYGGFAGLNFGRFTLLGEADIIEERVKGQEKQREKLGDQLAAFGELDFLLTRGINLKAAYDFYDPGRKLDEDERNRLTVGVEAFLTQFLQFRGLYRFADSVPQKPREREDQLIFEIHAFF